jgi:hypothetical protein
MRAKHFLTAAALVALSVSQASAQSGLTIKGGLSYSVAANSGLTPGATDRSGFALGIGATSASVVGLAVEALYAQRGYNSVLPGESRHVDYIDIPLYLRVAPVATSVTPFAYAGPQVSYELHCGDNGDSCPNSGREKFTYAGIIGGGVKFGALNGMSVEARYVYGLNDLKFSTVSSSESYKTRSLLVLVGFGN